MTEQRVEIELQCKRAVSYFECANLISPIHRLYLKNMGEEDLTEVTVEVTSNPQFILPKTIEQERLPKKYRLKFEAGAQLSPVFTVGCDEEVEGEIFVRVFLKKELLGEASAKITVLPFNVCDANENPERLAAFVRRSAETNRLLTQVSRKLKEWKMEPFLGGYAGKSKNDARYFVAATWAVFGELGLSIEEENGRVRSHSEILKKKSATPCEIALLLASVFEGGGLNPIVGRGKGTWFVGCFLSDECFADILVDDGAMIEKRAEAGVNELSLLSVSDLSAGVSFESAEKRARTALVKAQEDVLFADVRRARLLGIRPLADRVRKDGGYDLVASEDYMTGSAPSRIVEYSGSVAGRRGESREMMWERRLLDMDMRNALLNFKPSSYTVKILTGTLEDFLDSITQRSEYAIVERPSDLSENVVSNERFDHGTALKPVCDLVRFEFGNGHLCTLLSGKEYERALKGVYRKERVRQEEAGTASLYLAAGFLKWFAPGEEEKFAPIVLYPVTLKKKGAAKTTFALTVHEDEVHVNNTLLEFLYQQFNLDMRGLAEGKAGKKMDVRAILARFKSEIAHVKGWEVLSNVYLSSLSFSKYLMWSDVRHHMDKFRESKIIRSLVSNRSEFTAADAVMSDLTSDGACNAKDGLYLPIGADSSQYSAVYDSLSKSFVLHGPPGTGKSQTITNIIVNNIVRGRRVLFVAEKMAALSVVKKRLNAVGLGDFCLELHSDKIEKNEVLSKIIHTLQLPEIEKSSEYELKAAELESCVSHLQSELSALHEKRNLGFSVYSAILNYRENESAPDCFRIDSIFYEKLSEKTFSHYVEMLTELTARAKECGDLRKSPLRHVGLFAYTPSWVMRGESVLQVYLKELKHLRSYARNLLPVFQVRTVSLTGDRLKALATICEALTSDKYVSAFYAKYDPAVNAKKTMDEYVRLSKEETTLEGEFTSKFRAYPKNINLDELKAANENHRLIPRAVRHASQGVTRVQPTEREEYFTALFRLATLKEELKSVRGEVAKMFSLEQEGLADFAIAKLKKLYSAAEKLYAELDHAVFDDCCARLVKNAPSFLPEFYANAFRTCERANAAFEEVFCISGRPQNEDINQTVEYVVQLEKNMDMMPNWCRFQEIVDECSRAGFDFILEPLSMGEVSADDVLRCFKKSVYQLFIATEISLDERLREFSGLNLEEIMDRLKVLTEEFEKLSRKEIYRKLCEAIPRAEDEGAHNLEKVILFRAEKNRMKGTTLRKLFGQIPTILKATCPCMLMSPTSVTQFLDIDAEKFDLVVFDEASQVPTCEAVGTIARGKDVIVVGDPQQLPPTTFFGSDLRSEETAELDDLDSILDDCLAIGMPERHLLWHYRSHHESLIAFSNAMYYENALLTFPSPNELSSRVTLEYVDGIYDRGASKCNKKEAEALVAEVIARLSSPQTRSQSIGIVTFNTAQQNYVDDLLSAEIHKHGLDSVAYEVDEPVFVKNLENVQGDERDVIFFSVGYGPDAQGKLSLNFGPLNQTGGYRRLNVAVTRARMEMKVFSSITANMIDLDRTNAKGVRGLKAFLEYAERGRDMLVLDAKDIKSAQSGIGALVAADLKRVGLACDFNVGVSDFKIDVAVVDPRDKDKYILAILCDSDNAFKIKGARDRVNMHFKMLKTLGWNTYQLWTLNYFNNPRREIQKIKDAVFALTEQKLPSKKTVKDALAKYRKPYKQQYFKPLQKAGAEYVLTFANEENVISKMAAIISVEQPVEEQYLLERIYTIFGVPKTARKAVAKIEELLTTRFAAKCEVIDDKRFYLDAPADTFRPVDVKVPREIARIHPSEIVAACRCAIESKLFLREDELIKEVLALFQVTKKTRSAVLWLESVIRKAVRDGQLICTVDDVITM